MSEIKKGTHLSEVTKQKISKSMIGHEISDENLKKLTAAKLGKPRPDYVKVKISQANINKHTKQVFCIETATVFNSVKEAALFCGVSQCHLSNALTCRKQTAGGYHWI